MITGDVAGLEMIAKSYVLQTHSIKAMNYWPVPSAKIKLSGRAVMSQDVIRLILLGHRPRMAIEGLVISMSRNRIKL